MRLKAEGRVPYLVKKKVRPDLKELNSSGVYRYCCEEIGMHLFAEEYVYLFCLIGNRCNALFQVSQGCVNNSILQPREVFLRALLAGASHVVLAHNHPSGGCTPSSVDVSATRDIVTVGVLMHVPVVDHIIVGCNGYYSFRESGIIE